MQPWTRNPHWTTLLGVVSAFCAYSSMYAFRKGITAVSFDGLVYAGVSYKVWLVTAQVLGYALSKRIGVKFVSELNPSRRAVAILSLIGLAEAALLGFALAPAPGNIVFLLLNGLPLGMVYGIILGYLEGRQQTDTLVAGLTVSFIFASGMVKSVALWLKGTFGISELWLPFITGLPFFLPLSLSVYGLSLLPKPSPEDKAARTERSPMNRTERQKFLQTFAGGLLPLILSYVLLSAFRDFRDNFGPEILQSAGVQDWSIFARTESWVAVMILGLMSLLQREKNNFKAFQWLNLVMVMAAGLLGASTWAFQQGLLSVKTWYFLVGFSLYAAYVPCNGLYFERLVASFRYVSTVGFIVTLADYYGYLGSVAVLFYKNFGQPDVSFLQFFMSASYLLAAVYIILVSLSYRWFDQFYRQKSLVRN